MDGVAFRMQSLMEAGRRRGARSPEAPQAALIRAMDPPLLDRTQCDVGGEALVDLCIAVSRGPGSSVPAFTLPTHIWVKYHGQSAATAVWYARPSSARRPGPPQRAPAPAAQPLAGCTGKETPTASPSACACSALPPVPA